MLHNLIDMQSDTLPLEQADKSDRKVGSSELQDPSASQFSPLSSSQAELNFNENKQVHVNRLKRSVQQTCKTLGNCLIVFALILIMINVIFLTEKLIFSQKEKVHISKMASIEKQNEEIRIEISRLENEKLPSFVKKHEEKNAKDSALKNEKISSVEKGTKEIKDKIELVEKKTLSEIQKTNQQIKTKIDQLEKGKLSQMESEAKIIRVKIEQLQKINEGKSREQASKLKIEQTVQNPKDVKPVQNQKEASQKIKNENQQGKLSKQVKKERPKIAMQKIVNPIDLPSSFPEQQYLNFSYPTVGIPQPGKLFNNTPVSKFDLALFDHQINQLFKPFNDTDCEFDRWGEKEDGSYIVCQNHFSKASGIINIGINGFDMLGCQISSKFKIPNYQYECYDNRTTQCSTNNEGNVFLKDCLGAVTKKQQKKSFYSLQSILKRHDLLKKNIIFKIDCEGCEYSGLKYFPMQYLDYIDQILVEFHFDNIHRQTWGMLDIFKSIASKFVNVNYHSPYWGYYSKYNAKYRRLPGRTIQMTLVNKNLINLYSQSRSFQSHPFNFPGLFVKNETTPQQRVNAIESHVLPLDALPIKNKFSDQMTFPYPTVGIPQPGHKFNMTRVEKKDLSIFGEEINRLMMPYNDTDCQFEEWGESFRHIGHFTICKNYFSLAKGLINIGIGGYDDFGCEVSVKQGLPNYQYDCFDKSTPVCWASNGGNAFFSDCLGPEDQEQEKKSYYTLSTILKRHSLTKKHVVLKINCDGCEYNGLKYFPIEELESIDQIVVEFNFANLQPETWGILDIFRTLANKFIPVSYRGNHYTCFSKEQLKYRQVPSRTMSITLVNKKLIKVKSETRSLDFNPLKVKGCAFSQK